MIIDTSALIAILFDEVDAPEYAETIAQARHCSMSAANWLEAAVVADGTKDPIVARRFDDLVATTEMTIEPVTPRQVQIAREAYRDFGKGSGHPAKLNFGDCFAYALSRTTGEPLLFKGADFVHTDVASARR